MQRLRELCKEKNIIRFSVVWCVFAFVLFCVYYEAKLGSINSTSLAISYKYGFVSRGLIGTVFYLVDAILPLDMYQYHYAYRFAQISTGVFFVILFLFFLSCIIKSNNNNINKTKYISFCFTVFAVPMFITEFNLGRYDVYCLILSLIAAMLIIYEKAEWLVVLLSALGVMIHQGNVFMYLNIILVLLLYKAFSCESKIRIKYIVLFTLSFFVASILFVYFEFYSRENGVLYVDQIFNDAKKLSDHGFFHEDVIAHEVLGIDLSGDEIKYRLWNILDSIVFLLLSWPYIIIIFKFFKNVILATKNKIEKIKYIIITFGSVTMVPCFILKCDYGRWVFAVVSYYLIVILVLLALNDKIISGTMHSMSNKIKHKKVLAVFMFIYLFLFQPLQDVCISKMTFEIAKMINNNFLHWW